MSSLTVGVLFRFWKYKAKSNKYGHSFSERTKKTPPRLSSLGSILQSSIMSSIKTVVMIGGFVVLFSVIISILNNTRIFMAFSVLVSPVLGFFNIPASFGNGILSGIVELTNGVSVIANIPMKAISVNIIVCSFLLGFGGISVLLQVLSIISQTDISIKPYMIGKLMQGVIAAGYTFLLIQNFAIFNFDIYL